MLSNYLRNSFGVELGFIDLKTLDYCLVGGLWDLAASITDETILGSSVVA